MSASVEEPPGLDVVDDDVLLQRYDEWSKNLHSLAKSVCMHAPKTAVDSEGHHEWPCQRCVKTVRHITDYWWQALTIKSRVVAARAKKEGVALPLVDLQQALFIASSLLDPCTSVQLEGWGPA